MPKCVKMDILDFRNQLLNLKYKTRFRLIVTYGQKSALFTTRSPHNFYITFPLVKFHFWSEIGKNREKSGFWRFWAELAYPDLPILLISWIWGVQNGKPVVYTIYDPRSWNTYPYTYLPQLKQDLTFYNTIPLSTT